MLVSLNYHDARALRAAASTEQDCRPALCQARITKTYAEATNGHVLVRVPLKGDDLPDEGLDLSYLIPATSLKEIKRKDWLVLDTETLNITICEDMGGEITRLTLGPATLEDGDYPNTDQVIPDYRSDPKATTFALSSRVLKKLSDIASGTHSGSIRLTLRGPGEGLTFSQAGSDYSGVVMPCRVVD